MYQLVAFYNKFILLFTDVIEQQRKQKNANLRLLVPVNYRSYITEIR